MSINDYLYYVILPLLCLALVLVTIRFVIGPTIIDRIIALDLIVTIGIGIIAIYSVLYDQPNFLDIALILALIAFLGTVAFTSYIEKRDK
jgi:multicomponent Na+:H+ antiporter subunit F